ncbi:hypothetical protein [Aporhodopirellula aestuarii]|uniref:Transmembrane protein n=1 Tax=Aporhodopirellula aestuarii TaxID=2950107 RepID=A0ABT0U870_9BACT|nr:hypothetical protein [Aporhodopirellula aestuarii]MCM2372981.1 hypothetical protein [Aporhodopirellula aestuarii]
MHENSSENFVASSSSQTEEDLTGLPVVNTQSCCGLFQSTTLGRLGVALLAIVAVTATYAATYFAGMANHANSRPSDATVNWAGLPIANASAAVTSEKFSMCTGLISEESEALFVLDHNSGLLQCSVLYPRLGRFMATYTVNVADALGMDAKGGNYIMATGTADFPSSSNRPLGFSVVYVLDTASGNYASYGIPFDRTAMKANRPQQGVLFLIGQGTANPVVDRDDLR